MAIKYGNTTLSAIKYNGTNITQISYQGNIYKLVDSVKITFVEAGVSTTVAYAIGATVNRATAPSGATFVGWSASSSGSNPVTTFTATKDATYYRVVKYGNYVVVNKLKSSDYYGTKFGPYTVNPSNYPSLSILATASTGSGRLALSKTSYDRKNDGGYSVKDAFHERSVTTSTNYTSVATQSPFYIYIHCDPEEAGINNVTITAIGSGQKVG